MSNIKRDYTLGDLQSALKHETNVTLNNYLTISSNLVIPDGKTLNYCS